VPNDPRGGIVLDALGNPEMDVYIRKVERRDNGKLVNSVVKTYPKVSQFWSYGRTQFLASPVYSRDYPPATNLEK
jgi:branched-chain amino acid transport system substrate-binding protein